MSEFDDDNSSGEVTVVPETPLDDVDDSDWTDDLDNSDDDARTPPPAPRRVGELPSRDPNAERNFH